MGDWIIIRTKPSSTLTLAAALAEDGFQVWTPTEVQVRRVPRAKAKIERTVAIMPTFIFAREEHLDDLLSLSKSSISPYPDFSIFHHRSRTKIPTISDDTLQALREAEEAAERRTAARRAAEARGKRAEPFEAGETVKIPDGSFAGLEGIIEGSDGKDTLVCFGGRMTVKISTYLLRHNNIGPADGVAFAA